MEQCIERKKLNGIEIDRPIQSDTNVCFSKVCFLAYIAMVINCDTKEEEEVSSDIQRTPMPHEHFTLRIIPSIAVGAVLCRQLHVFIFD
jgi:hypothetical protein